MDQSKAPVGNAIMILLWLVLFGGRWLIAPVFQIMGLLTRKQLADWDAGILLQSYLALLAVTCLIVALRAVRNAQATAQSKSFSPDPSSAPDRSAPSAKPARRDKTSD